MATLEQRKASIGSSHSNQAYQNAESGVEAAMNTILASPNSSIGSLGYSCSSSNHIATYVPNPNPNNYTIQLKKSDSSDASGESYITDCNTKANQVSDIKSIGSDAGSQDTRVVEAAVASGALNWNKVTDFDNGWKASGNDTNNPVECATDTRTGLTYLKGEPNHPSGKAQLATGKKIFTLPSGCNPPPETINFAAINPGASYWILVEVNNDGTVTGLSNDQNGADIGIDNISLGMLTWTTDSNAY